MTNYRKILILVIIAIIIPAIASAQHCVDVSGDALGSYISKVFKWSLRIAGLAAFGALIYGGFRYLTSAGSPTAISAARKQMLAAVLGLILLLGSYIILRTINPALVGKIDQQAKPKEGICFYGQMDSKQVRCCYTESSKKMPPNFEPQEVEFESIERDLPRIFLFSNQDWEPITGTSPVPTTNCREDYSADPCPKSAAGTKSFFLDWNKPGVYLYKKTMGGAGVAAALTFPDEPYQVHRYSASDLENYNDQVKSLRLRPGGKCLFLGTTIPGLNPIPKIGPYGVILHEETEFEGICRVIFPEPDMGGPLPFGYCEEYKIPNLGSGAWEIGQDEASSVTVFWWKTLGHDTGAVSFYEKKDEAGDHFKIEAGTIVEYWEQDFDYPIEDGDLGGVDVIKGDNPNTDDEKLEEIRSIKIEGKFLVVLGRNKVTLPAQHEFRPFCEVTTKNIPQIEGHHVVHDPEDARVNSIAIIPLKRILEKPELP